MLEISGLNHERQSFILAINVKVPTDSCWHLNIYDQCLKELKKIQEILYETKQNSMFPANTLLLSPSYPFTSCSATHCMFGLFMFISLLFDNITTTAWHLQICLLIHGK